MIAHTAHAHSIIILSVRLECDGLTALLLCAIELMDEYWHSFIISEFNLTTTFYHLRISLKNRGVSARFVTLIIFSYSM